MESVMSDLVEEGWAVGGYGVESSEPSDKVFLKWRN